MLYQTEFNELNARLDALLGEMKNADELTLHRQPGGKWSAVQHLEHARRSEALSLGYLLKKQNEFAEFSKAGIGSYLRSVVLKVALRSGMKFRAPAPQLENIENIMELEQVEQDFGKVRGQLADFLKEFPQKFESKVVYKHPRVGRMTLEQMLVFFGDHFYHHAKIIRTRLKTEGNEQE